MSNTYTGLSSTTRLASSGTAAHGGLFALNRLVASKNGGGGRNYNDSSDYTANLRRNAIGKSSYANSSNTQVTNYTDGANKNTVTQATRKARSGGSVAPAKKGAK